MAKNFYVGVDGGATKCTVRLEDEAGNLLGQAVTGPANIRISVTDAWKSIHTALEKICHTSTITLNRNDCQIHAGVGIAGCEIQSAYHEFISYPHSFASLFVTTDAETACAGAHGGRDGALIIAGTGVVAYQIENGTALKVAGFGFPHDDLGGGAWLGLEAVKIALQAQDGRTAKSGLSAAVLSHFSNEMDALVKWANQANSTAFAELAPVVVKSAEARDATAQALLQRAAHEIDLISNALAAGQRATNALLPCALIGGVAPFIKPYLSTALKARLVTPAMPPEAGAIILARKQLAALGEKI